MELQSHIPLHHQLREYLEKEIKEGRYKAGDLLPAEPELMTKFKVSRGTVRKAYDALVSMDLVERRSGKGSFVKEQKPDKLRIGIVVSSTQVFDASYNPTNWELGVDKLNGIFAAAILENVDIELVHYTPDMFSLYDHDGFLILGEISGEFSYETPVPAVLVTEKEYADQHEIANVCFDIKQSFEEATDYIASLGFKRIAYIGGKDKVRFGSFKNALKKYKCKFYPSLVEEAMIGTVEDGYDAAARLFGRTNDIDAVFCVTDLRALGVMKYLKDNNIRVPDDVAVMGFDNLKAAALSEPGLSTYATPRFECGKTALTMLTEMIRKPLFKPENIILKGQLIERESTANKAGMKNEK